ncbi:putative DNA metabolism protein [Natranaerovirga pectinivora]|uniref:Putative DNA metabolism protein n=1 Tax=Natranaerovirga pectinivora TaxID=682400 RepID=A0A4R3MD51_9FIRM|nr:TIGR03915 family putative DNA repair protein [Natranaerovirga pectinivora]TCT11664.1 putative DNA metabolism protein [Natranaerovirga pectinivora]
MDYLYDGTFDGFLTCIYYHYYKEKALGIYPNASYQYNLIDKYAYVETEIDKSKKVSKAIREKISFEALRHLNSVFLSNDDFKENKMLNYIVYGFKMGKDINNYFTHPTVAPILKLSKRVNMEAHRFLGLVRFIEVGNVLFAEIEPDHNILPIILKHFVDRFKTENFIINDKKRKIALAYNKKDYIISDYHLDSELPISEKEKEFQSLWKNYFENISIKSRENAKLQQQFVPLKYRKHLMEFNGEYN